MRSKFNELIVQFRKAVTRFEEVLREEKNDIIRDSAIQRFEFTFELAWKTLKAYAIELKGANKDLYSPRDVLKTAYQLGLIENDPKWLEMIDTRNKTSHLYNEAMADDVYKDLPGYLPLLKKLAEELT